MTSLELLTCVVLVLLSASISASEIALFSLSRFQLRSLKENFRPTHRQIKRLLSDPGGLLITTLVVNEILNIGLSTLITGIVTQSGESLTHRIDDWPKWAMDLLFGTLLTTPLILFFCEITPKVIGSKMNQLISTASAGPLLSLYRIFRPIRLILKQVIRLFSPSQHPAPTQEHILNESDFLLLLEEGRKEGAIQEGEIELIRNVFELDNTLVSEISTPLSKVLTLPSHATIKGALATVRNQRYSRIPILDSQKKGVVGILYSKDLIRSKLSAETPAPSVASLMRKPVFVNSTMRVNALFRKFKQQRIHMAIVKNANGETLGVVTMSDILDSLFEDFFPDEEDIESIPSHLESGRK